MQVPPQRDCATLGHPTLSATATPHFPSPHSYPALLYMYIYIARRYCNSSCGAPISLLVALLPLSSNFLLNVTVPLRHNTPPSTTTPTLPHNPTPLPAGLLPPPTAPPQTATKAQAAAPGGGRIVGTVSIGALLSSSMPLPPCHLSPGPGDGRNSYLQIV